MTFGDASELSPFRPALGVEQAHAKIDEVRCDQVQLLAVGDCGQHQRAHLRVQRQVPLHDLPQRVRVELVRERLQLLEQKSVEEVQRHLLMTPEVGHGQKQGEAEGAELHLAAAH